MRSSATAEFAHVAIHADGDDDLRLQVAGLCFNVVGRYNGSRCLDMNVATRANLNGEGRSNTSRGVATTATTPNPSYLKTGFRCEWPKPSNTSSHA